jgi:ribosomal protein L37AE/L43A
MHIFRLVAWNTLCDTFHLEATYKVKDVRVKLHAGKRFIGTTERTIILETQADLAVPEPLEDLLAVDSPTVISKVIGVGRHNMYYACPVCKRKTTEKDSPLLMFCESCSVTRVKTSCEKQYSVQIHLEYKSLVLVAFSTCLQIYYDNLSEAVLSQIVDDTFPTSITRFSAEQMELFLLLSPTLKISYWASSKIIGSIAPADV